MWHAARRRLGKLQPNLQHGKKKIGKLVKAGVFKGASASSGTTSNTDADQPSKQKRGAANAVVEEEDDG
jgi:hypothetical protein